MQEKRVLGIDPGSQVTGWGIVEEKSGVLTLVGCGAIKAKGDDFAKRLAYIFWELTAIINMQNPTEAAIESMFSAHNVGAALKLGQARGIALAACANKGLEIYDYAPTAVKKALVGVGRAEKSQVAYMVANALGIKPNSITWALDTSDAIAIAICHLNMVRYTNKLRA